MITGEIHSYIEYKHKESGRLAWVINSTLQIKVTDHWITAVHYRVDDQYSGAEFAVPVDHFRIRFEKAAP